MEQRTNEWFAARKGRVTGSNVGAILDLNEHRKPADVMRAMVREYHNAEPEFTGNVATRYGTFHEDLALQDFRMDVGMEVDDCGFFPYEDWLGASPDGLIGNSAVLEIKCPYSKRNAKSERDFKDISEQLHYFAQMQIEMFCSDRKEAYFYQWSTYAASCVVIDRDDAWLAMALPKLKAFHDEFLKEIHNPIHLEPKRTTLSGADVMLLINNYDKACADANAALVRKKECLDAIVELANHKDVDIDGRMLTKVKREGSVSYAKIVKEHCADVDLDAYRGEPSEYWLLK